MRSFTRVACFLLVLWGMPGLAFAQVDTSMVVTSIGNVGIGTVNPEHMVHVYGTGFTTLNQPIFKAETDGGQFGPQLRLKHNGPAGQEWLLVSGGSGNAAVQAGNLGFVQEGIGPRMLINSNGDVGIGINPVTNLHVSSSADQTELLLDNTNPEAVRSFVKFRFPGINEWIVGMHGADQDKFKIANTGDFGSLDRLTITQAGNVGIGTATPGHPLEMASGAHVTAGGVWTDASSRDLKENIEDLSAEAAITALMQLTPKQYNYIRDQDESHVGFIAEDVPDLVAMNNRKSLSSMDIVAVLTKVVQQQQAQIEELKAMVNAQY